MAAIVRSTSRVLYANVYEIYESCTTLEGWDCAGEAAGGECFDFAGVRRL